MEILLKYQFAESSSTIYFDIYSSHGAYNRYFRVNLKMPILLVCQQRHRGIRVESNDSISVLSNEREDAFSVLKKMREDLLRDYSSVVDFCRTFDELIKVIPDAKALGAKLYPTNNALSVLSPDLIGRIKSDLASRKKMIAA